MQETFSAGKNIFLSAHSEQVSGGAMYIVHIRDAHSASWQVHNDGNQHLLVLAE